MNPMSNERPPGGHVLNRRRSRRPHLPPGPPVSRAIVHTSGLIFARDESPLRASRIYSANQCPPVGPGSHRQAGYRWVLREPSDTSRTETCQVPSFRKPREANRDSILRHATIARYVLARDDANNMRGDVSSRSDDWHSRAGYGGGTQVRDRVHPPSSPGRAWYGDQPEGQPRAD